MTGAELKEALQNGKKVVLNLPRSGTFEFDCLSAVIYRRGENGQIKVSAELLDKSKNSVIIAEPKRVEYA